VRLEHYESLQNTRLRTATLKSDLNISSIDLTDRSTEPELLDTFAGDIIKTMQRGVYVTAFNPVRISYKSVYRAG
jgi:hypothetical protein